MARLVEAIEPDESVVNTTEVEEPAPPAENSTIDRDTALLGDLVRNFLVSASVRESEIRELWDRVVRQICVHEDEAPHIQQLIYSSKLPSGEDISFSSNPGSLKN